MVCNSIVQSLVPTEQRARSARAAALAFVNEAACGWGRAELADWLVSHYAPAVHHMGSLPGGQPRRSGDFPVDDASVARLVADARMRVANFLQTVTSTDPAELARESLEQGLVLPAQDRVGGIGFLPVSTPAMRLVARVIGLFVADYLARPEDYEDITICRECGMVGFGPAEAHAAWCEPKPSSGVFRRAAIHEPEPFPLVRHKVA